MAHASLSPSADADILVLFGVNEIARVLSTLYPDETLYFDNASDFEHSEQKLLWLLSSMPQKAND